MGIAPWYYLAVKLGPYTLDSLETGRFALDGGAMFGSVPKALWSRTHPADERNRIEMALRCLLIRGEGRTILVDTGIGHKWTGKEEEIYAIDHRERTLDRALGDKGVTPDDVTDLIITHLHFDHAGGATTREGKALRPTFPNARVHLQEANLKTARRPNLRERRSYLPENFEPLHAADCLQLYRGEAEILAGIRVLPVSGHTDGQHIVKIEAADGEAMIYCGDLIPTSSHVPLPWVMGYDLRPMDVMREKEEILTEAVRRDWCLFFEHDPKVAAARVTKTDRGFAVGETVTL